MYNLAESKFKIGIAAYGIYEEKTCNEVTEVCEESENKIGVDFFDLEPLITFSVEQENKVKRKTTTYPVSPTECNSHQSSTTFVTEKALCFDSIDLQGDIQLGDGKIAKIKIDYDEDCVGNDTLCSEDMLAAKALIFKY